MFNVITRAKAILDLEYNLNFVEAPFFSLVLEIEPRVLHMLGSTLSSICNPKLILILILPTFLSVIDCIWPVSADFFSELLVFLNLY